MLSRRTKVSYSGRDRSHASFNASLVSLIILGLSLMFVGTYDINYTVRFIDFDDNSFVCSNIIFSVLLMLYSVYAIKSKIITEGIFYMLASFSSVLVTLEVYYGEYSINFLLLYFIVGFFGCAMIFWNRRERALMLTSLFFILYSALVNLTPADFSYIYGILIFIWGLLLVLLGCVAMVEIDSGILRRTPPKSMEIKDEDYPVVLENTVGSILLALITFLYVYAVYKGYNVTLSYNIFTTIAASITIIVAAYGIYHKVIGQTVLMFLLAASKFIFTIYGYLGLGSTTHIDLVFVVIFIPLIVTFYMKKQYSVALLTFATMITTVAQTFIGYFFIVELLMGFTNVVAIYFALDTWYLAEVGIKLKDTEIVRRIIGGVADARGR